MAPKPTDADRLARRLAGYGLGVGAVAAGITLPQKANADIIYEPITGATAISNWNVVFLQWPYQTDIQAGSSGCFSAGFNFQLYCACTMSGFFFQGVASGCYTYSILAVCNSGCEFGAMKWTGADTGFDLANPDYSYYGWATRTYQLTPLVTDVPFFVGLRMQASSGTYHGWAQVELGSLSINGSAFNDEDDGPIHPGQIPEPSSLLLLLSGAAGLSALRKRRESTQQE